jgi:uncharacterized protein (TIGR03435 family)
VGISRGILPAALAAFTAGVLAGQSTAAAPEFEVASVKASQSTDRSKADTSPAGRLTIDGSLGYVLKWAYDLKNYQFSGPDWLDTARYQIAAKAPGPADVKNLKLMLQGLLAERFQLTFHRESKDLMVYALVVWKDGPKLQESQAGGDSVTQTNARKPGGGGTLLRTSMGQFADLLNGSCPDPIVDMTGLKGRYDFTLDVSSYLRSLQPGDLPVVLTEALRQQLGLNLEHRKVSIERMVVDHVERVPREN